MTNDLKLMIEEIIREQLKSINVESVEIVPDLDFDGDEVLRVSIVFAAEEKLDAQDAKGLVRHIRHALAGSRNTTDAFPMLSFISHAENERMKAATG